MSEHDSPQSPVLRVTRTLAVEGKAVRVTLEADQWLAFDEIGQREGLSANELMARIESQRDTKERAPAIRAFVLRYQMDAFAQDPPRPRGMAEGDGDGSSLSPTLSAALDRIGPKPKG
jgi:predicted DNA-binding ribbon-helix-helix protein